MPGRTTAKTELFSSWQTGQLVIADQGMSTGGRLWVHSTSGFDTTGHGRSPNSPCATLNYANGLATGDHKDVIYLMPHHAETISTAALSPTLTKIGLKVIGLGQGHDRPTFTFTHVNGNVVVAAVDVWLENIIFVAGIDNVVELLDIDFCDCTVKDCEFRSDVNFQATTAIDINGGGANAADRPHIWHNKFQSMDAGAVNAIEIGAVQDGVWIEDNWISGDYSDAAISSGSILTNANISRNYIRNTNAGDWAIELTGAASGVCNDNRLATDAVATALDPGSLMCNGNLWVGGIDRDGVQIPTVGNVGDVVLDEPLAGHLTQNTLGGAAASCEMCCEKSDGAVLNGADPLFTIAGGPIEILSITGIVTTLIVGAANASLQLVTTTPAATVDLNAAPVAIDDDAAGTSYRSINTTGVFTPVTAGFVLKANAFAALDTTYLAPIGTLQCLCSAARVGVIKWYLRYKPLSPNSVVTAAA